MYGRRVIYTDKASITKDNVMDVLRESVAVHRKNRAEIQKLWDIYRGKTDILNKKKEVRDNINYKVCENRAFEIVNFYTGYVFGEPIQYIHRGECRDDEGISRLNSYMDMAGKDACDSEIAEWMYICGVGYRLVLADYGPFSVYSLDPRDTFVVRYSGVGHRPAMAVTCAAAEHGDAVYTCYTAEQVFIVRCPRPGVPIQGEEGAAAFQWPGAGELVQVTPNGIGEIPIVEYAANQARLGVFEPVVPLLNALNSLQSNRMDDVEATVNAFMVLLGCGIGEEQYKQLKEQKLLSLPEGTDAKYLTCSLDQSGIQTLKEDLYQSILTICGMPNRNGGYSTSDTGSAVILRDGWQSAESRAKSTETLFKRAERQFLRVAIQILRNTPGAGVKIRPEDIVIKFTRRNYDNLQTKAQVLTELLNDPNIHPETAFVSCGLFVDPIGEYKRGQQWRQEQQRREAQSEANQVSQVQETGAESGGNGAL